jgi:GT2 family glycosyltransferase
MKVSILISTYNGGRDIPLLLNSIEKLALGSHELEVILRDDNSSDRTMEKVSKNYPWIRTISGERNIGFVGSTNIAMGQASGDVICCVNQDTILDSNFVLEGLTVLESYPDVVGINTNMIMPWVLSLDDFERISYKDLPAYEYQLTAYGFTRYVRVDPILRQTNFLTGGGFFLRRSALEEGEALFDPRIQMYCEDTELALRLKKRGGILMYAPTCIIFHCQAAKRARSFGELKKLLKITWNRFYVLSKHFRPREFFKHYPLYVMGIIRKMDHLGLPRSKKFEAYLTGGCLSLVFLSLMPYWLWYSHVSNKEDRNNL